MAIIKIAIAAIILVIVVVGGFWYFTSGHGSSSTPSSTIQSTTVVPVQSTATTTVVGVVSTQGGWLNQSNMTYPQFANSIIHAMNATPLFHVNYSFTGSVPAFTVNGVLVVPTNGTDYYAKYYDNYTIVTPNQGNFNGNYIKSENIEAFANNSQVGYYCSGISASSKNAVSNALVTLNCYKVVKPTYPTDLSFILLGYTLAYQSDQNITITNLGTKSFDGMPCTLFVGKGASALTNASFITCISNAYQVPLNVTAFEVERGRLSCRTSPRLRSAPLSRRRL